MNILFMSLGQYNSINERGIYTDLLREFIKQSNKIFIVSPIEKAAKDEKMIIEEEHSVILRVETGKITKTNIIEKGINTVLLEKRFISALEKNFRNIKFDMILFPTPPITFAGAVEYIKLRDNAKTYLMLKDIFPQNAVDIGLMKKTGLRGFLYKYFRKKEKKLYEVSDYIGCMSQANIDYIIEHNHEIDVEKIEICPNVIDPIDRSVTEDNRILIREKYGIPVDKTVFVYGGNLGKPQGIPFIIDCLKSQKYNNNAFFLIVGDGTEFYELENFISNSNQNNIKLMKSMPKEDYEIMIGSCDVGMIFLDHRFTIPNFPSRLLSYMQAKLPILAVTDPNTDVGQVIINGGFGWWCESNNSHVFSDIVNKIIASDVNDNKKLGINGWNYLLENYNSKKGYEIIMKNINYQ